MRTSQEIHTYLEPERPVADSFDAPESPTRLDDFLALAVLGLLAICGLIICWFLFAS